MDELERALRALWNDRERAEEMGAAGRRYLRENYALDVVASAYAEVFAEAMGAEASRPAAVAT